MLFLPRFWLLASSLIRKYIWSFYFFINTYYVILFFNIFLYHIELNSFLLHYSIYLLIVMWRSFVKLFIHRVDNWFDRFLFLCGDDDGFIFNGILFFRNRINFVIRRKFGRNVGNGAGRSKDISTVQTFLFS